MVKPVSHRNELLCVGVLMTKGLHQPEAEVARLLEIQVNGAIRTKNWIFHLFALLASASFGVL